MLFVMKEVHCAKSVQIRTRKSPYLDTSRSGQSNYPGFLARNSKSNVNSFCNLFSINIKRLNITV